MATREYMLGEQLPDCTSPSGWVLFLMYISHNLQLHIWLPYIALGHVQALSALVSVTEALHCDCYDLCLMPICAEEFKTEILLCRIALGTRWRRRRVIMRA